ncbi:hypothetical protein EAF04_008574 [Stromatinia cepivora]|nr:hypothetical protein EAF04_008574 [Stromatinia cepivora]
MLRDARNPPLTLSEKAWKELLKEIADSGQEPLAVKSANKYFKDICSDRPERQDRGVTEKTMMELHAATMMVIIERYEPRRRSLQLLVSQINEWHARWFPDPEVQSQLKQEDDTGAGSGVGRREGKGKGRADH